MSTLTICAFNACETIEDAKFLWGNIPHLNWSGMLPVVTDTVVSAHYNADYLKTVKVMRMPAEEYPRGWRIPTETIITLEYPRGSVDFVECALNSIKEIYPDAILVFALDSEPWQLKS